MAKRYEEVFDVSASVLLEGENGLRKPGQVSLDLLDYYGDLLPKTAHDAVEAYIKHIVTFFTTPDSHQSFTDKITALERPSERSRDGWPWGLRHFAQVLYFKCAQVAVPITRLNMQRGKKVRIGNDYHWQTQMYVLGQSEPIPELELYRGGASPVITQMAQAIDFKDGVYPASVFDENIPHFSWYSSSNVMFLFLRNNKDTYIVLQFSGDYTHEQYHLARGIADEYMEEYGAADSERQSSL